MQEMLRVWVFVCTQAPEIMPLPMANAGCWQVI
jgi:hypothetical protein